VIFAYLELRGSRRSGRAHRVSAMHFGVGDATTTEAVEVEEKLRCKGDGDGGVTRLFKDVEARGISENNYLRVEKVEMRQGWTEGVLNVIWKTGKGFQVWWWWW
jgi:hypothetical protein